MGATPPRSPDGGVRLDTIRSQLKELGYLKGPLSSLEEWMLAGRGGPSSFGRINMMASLRVALIGGPLLGLPAAAAVAISNRPHIAAPRDLLLLFLYLSVALGAALGALEFLTDTVLAWLGRRGLVLVGGAEKVAARVGLLFFAATTLYLAWLFRGGRAALMGPRAGGSSEGIGAWLVWMAAVVGALGIGHLIGRLARIGSLVSLIAAGGGRDLARRLAGPAPRRPLLAAGVAALLLAAGLLVFLPAGPGEGGSRGASRFERRPVKGRIAFIGVDGLGADWYDEMKRLGACPTIARLEAGGARYDLEAEVPRVPPVVWTTIATGRPGSQHGILGFQAEHVPGMTVPVQATSEAAAFSFSLRMLLPPLRPALSPVSSGLRRELAVWEILADAGVPTAVVNWWATWPADSAEGIVVSERAFPRFAAGEPPDRDAAPAALQSELAARFRADLQEVQRSLSSSSPHLPDDLVATSAVIDGYHAEVTSRLTRSGLAQAVFVYLPGLDIARVRAAGDPQRADLVLTRLLANLDRIVGGFLELGGPDDLLLIAGDPGRGLAGDRGLVLVWGERVVPGRRTRIIRPHDLAPTLLALTGFPMARDLPGSPVVDFLKVGDVATRLPGTIESYGTRPSPLPGPTVDPFDKEVLERLRSLGYIQ